MELDESVAFDLWTSKVGFDFSFLDKPDYSDVAETF